MRAARPPIAPWLRRDSSPIRSEAEGGYSTAQLVVRLPWLFRFPKSLLRSARNYRIEVILLPQRNFPSSNNLRVCVWCCALLCHPKWTIVRVLAGLSNHPLTIVRENFFRAHSVAKNHRENSTALDHCAKKNFSRANFCGGKNVAGAAHIKLCNFLGDRALKLIFPRQFLAKTRCADPTF